MSDTDDIASVSGEDTFFQRARAPQLQSNEVRRCSVGDSRGVQKNVSEPPASGQSLDPRLPHPGTGRGDDETKNHHRFLGVIFYLRSGCRKRTSENIFTISANEGEKHLTPSV